MQSILVIEDDNVMGVILQLVLEKRGYKVSVIKNGQEAFNLLNQHSFDLIIADLMLPSGGLELLAQLKTNTTHKNIPVIIIATVAEENTIQQAFDLGADDFLKKPCAPGELISRVQRLLTSQTMAR
jgi:DNA-binding response OmpR family regulator